MRTILTALFLSFFLATGPVLAAELPEGSALLAADPIAAKIFAPEENAEKKPKAEFKVIDVQGQKFAKAMQVSATDKSSEYWKTQLMFEGNPSKKDDIALLKFWMRGESKSETGEARVMVYFQRNAVPYDKAFSQEITVGNTWREFLIPFKIQADFEKAGTMLCFGLGYSAQTVEIGGLECINYEKKVKLTDLPRTKPTYSGREADAAWRKEAEDRIEKIRKGNLKVLVVDAAGKPVENAQVKVNLTRHAFGFGTAVGAYHLAEFAGTPWNGPLPKGITAEQQKEMTEKYATQIKKLFNKVTPENDLKWQGWLGKTDERTNKDKTLRALTWLKENGIEVRGHVLVWPSFKNSPAFVRDLRTDKVKLAAAITDHIKEEASATKDLVSEFDVLNEPFDNKDFMNILGQDAMVDWFKTAREALGPNVKTFINDYDILETGGFMDTPHQKSYYDTIKFLLDKGAPLDGIGFQSHFAKSFTPPATCLKILDRFAEFKKILQITEFDVNTPDEELQADYTRDFLTLAFSHPAVNSFTMWGFWENKHWLPNGAMYRKDWSPKPNAKVYDDLVFKKWWTTAEGKTAAGGAYSTRGFFGEYEIEVSANGKTVKSKGKLTADETPVTVKVE